MDLNYISLKNDFLIYSSIKCNILITLSMQENLLLNEGYNPKEYVNNSDGTYIVINKKKFIDLSCCAGSQILGHNNIEIKKFKEK